MPFEGYENRRGNVRDFLERGRARVAELREAIAYRGTLSDEEYLRKVSDAIARLEEATVTIPECADRLEHLLAQDLAHDARNLCNMAPFVRSNIMGDARTSADFMASERVRASVARSAMCAVMPSKKAPAPAKEVADGAVSAFRRVDPRVAVEMGPVPEMAWVIAATSYLLPLAKEAVRNADKYGEPRSGKLKIQAKSDRLCVTYSNRVSTTTFSRFPGGSGTELNRRFAELAGATYVSRPAGGGALWEAAVEFPLANNPDGRHEGDAA